MQKQGKAVDPARFETLSQKIQHQVARADDIIKRLNRFSHSVDETCMTVDLADTIEFMIAICARLTAGRRKKLDLIRPEQPITLVTNLFGLENILWHCFDFAMSAAGDSPSISIGLETDSESNVRVHFNGLTEATKYGNTLFPGEKEAAILENLGGSVVLGDGDTGMVLTLPRRR